MNYFPYLVFFVFILFLFYTENSFLILNKKTKKSLDICIYYIFFLVTIVFICCRGYVGADWFYYKPFFEKAPSLLSNNNSILKFWYESTWGKGYTFFNILCKTFSNQYFFLQFTSGLIDIILLHNIFSYYCPKKYLLAWAIFFAFNGYSFEILYLRNTKSIYLFIISLRYLNKSQYKYFLLNLLGFLFHTSAILYFPLYFFLKAKINKKLFLIIFFIGIFVFITRLQWLKILLSQIVSFVPGSTGVRLSYYLRAAQWSAEYSFSLGMIERLISFFIIYYFYDDLIKKGLEPIIKLFFIFIYLYLYCSEFAIVIARITALFIPAYWILFPNLYALLKKEKKILFILVFLTYCGLKIKTAMSINWAFYENFLFSDCDPLIRKIYYF